MVKTYYISIDNGKTFRRFTKDKARFMRHMWETLTRELYPLSELSVRRDAVEINIREAKGMREIHTFYLDSCATLEQLWGLINDMWQDIEVYC